MDYFYKRFKARNKSHHIGSKEGKFPRTIKSLGQVADESLYSENNVIYIHVPFCSKICSFCNMRRSLSKADPGYGNLLVKNIELMASKPIAKASTIDSIYFGGGTPTSLSAEDLATVLEALAKNFNLTKTCEISMETSLTEMPVEKLKILRDYGLNRISVGVQTFNDRGRKLFARKSDGDFAKKRLTEYLDIGFENVNIDVIYNYPSQTLGELEEDLKTLKEIDLAGFSLYSLILNDQASLIKLLSEKDLEEAKDLKRDYKFYNYLVDGARKEGYKFLELTKMVKEGRDQYKYIVRRHQQKHTFPIGAGAGGNIGAGKLMVPLDLNEYKEFLDDFDNAKVFHIGGDYLNFSKALAAVQFGKIDPSLVSESSKNIVIDYGKSLVEDKLAIQENEIFHLNSLGKFWGNNISAEYHKMLVDNW